MDKQEELKQVACSFEFGFYLLPSHTPAVQTRYKNRNESCEHTKNYSCYVRTCQRNFVALSHFWDELRRVECQDSCDNQLKVTLQQEANPSIDYSVPVFLENSNFRNELV